MLYKYINNIRAHGFILRFAAFIAREKLLGAIEGRNFPPKRNFAANVMR